MARRFWTVRALALAAVGAFAVACGEDDTDPTEPVPSALAGDWEANPDCQPTCEFSVTLSESGQTISLLDPPISASVEVSIATGGGFVLRARLFASEFTGAGTARTEGSTVYITLPTGAVDTAVYTIAGDHLTLDYQNEITRFDFDGNGTPDRGRVRAVLRRR